MLLLIKIVEFEIMNTFVFLKCRVLDNHDTSIQERGWNVICISDLSTYI